MPYRVNEKVLTISVKRVLTECVKRGNHYKPKENAQIELRTKSFPLLGRFVTIKRVHIRPQGAIYFIGEDNLRYGWEDWMFEGNTLELTKNEIRKLLDD